MVREEAIVKGAKTLLIFAILSAVLPIIGVVLKKSLDGWIIAKCVDVKGAVSQGRNFEEAVRNVIEAISAILEDV
jgi:hypothetical protein